MGKQKVSELAIAGGEPEFTRQRHVGQPNIGDCDNMIARINRMLDARWLTNNGEFIQQFQQELVRLTGARHGVAMANGILVSRPPSGPLISMARFWCLPSIL